MQSADSHRGWRTLSDFRWFDQWSASEVDECWITILEPIREDLQSVIYGARGLTRARLRFVSRKKERKRSRRINLKFKTQWGGPPNTLKRLFRISIARGRISGNWLEVSNESKGYWWAADVIASKFTCMSSNLVLPHWTGVHTRS